MNIVVCCKFVPCLQDMEKGADGSVNFSKAEWQISDYDLQAIEAGAQLAKARGAKLIALSLGGKRIDDSKLRKDLLSRGPDELYLIVDDELQNAETGKVAELLAAAVRKLDADLVICGEGSADYYYQQTGLQLGEKLGWNCLNAVDAVQVQDEVLIAERVLEKEIETVSVPLPAVLSVTSSINTPPRPNMRAVLSAGKKPFTVWTPAELELTYDDTLNIVSTLAPKSVDRKGIIVEGDADAAAAELVKLLKGEGIL